VTSPAEKSRTEPPPTTATIGQRRVLGLSASAARLVVLDPSLVVSIAKRSSIKADLHASARRELGQQMVRGDIEEVLKVLGDAGLNVTSTATNSAGATFWRRVTLDNWSPGLPDSGSSCSVRR